MKQAILLYGATAMGSAEFSADLLWRIGGFSVPDPVVYVEIEGKKILLLSSLECERGEKEASVDEIVLINEYFDKAKETGKSISTLFLQERGVEEVIVPASIRYSLAKRLEEHFTVTVKEAPFYPDRAIKTEYEVSEIEKAQRAVETAVAEGMQFIQECLVKGGRLFHAEFPNRAVASDHLRKIIDDRLYLLGYLGVESIVSGGIEAADPHSVGYGELHPGEPIVLDIFPRSLKTLYFADQTRTIFKGEPNEKLKRMYDAVLEAQNLAIGMVKAGENGAGIEASVRQFFESRGYPTHTSLRPVGGFIHSLGHGVGLEIHEEPSLSQRGDILEAGNIVTVEPGLYYTESSETIPTGGIRIEDMLLVTEAGSRNLTRFPKRFDEMVLE